jgi:hypothetical protein
MVWAGTTAHTASIMLGQALCLGHTNQFSQASNFSPSHASLMLGLGGQQGCKATPCCHQCSHVTAVTMTLGEPTFYGFRSLRIFCLNSWKRGRGSRDAQVGPLPPTSPKAYWRLLSGNTTFVYRLRTLAPNRPEELRKVQSYRTLGHFQNIHLFSKINNNLIKFIL